MSINGKCAIVTGAAHGIGRAIAERFAQDGAKVMIADVDGAAAEAVAQDIEKAGGTAMAFKCDIGKRLDVRNLVTRTLNNFEHIDILVNNAGITHAADFLELDIKDFDRVLEVNLRGAFLTGQAVARQMVKQIEAGGEPGTIINMSSVNAVFALANQVPYSISKGGMNQLTKVMALSLAPHGIRVNAIGPGSIMTEMLEKVVWSDPAARNKVLSRTPAGPCRRAARDRGCRGVPGQQGVELHHRPDDLCRRRAAAAQLHRAGQRELGPRNRGGAPAWRPGRSWRLAGAAYSLVSLVSLFSSTSSSASPPVMPRSLARTVSGFSSSSSATGEAVVSSGDSRRAPSSTAGCGGADLAAR